MASESMAARDSTKVFVSYCHADSSLVAPVVQLLRLNKSLVFHDIDSIRPGRKWRVEIDRALADSNLVVVFWCDHARHSDEVTKEWQTAIDREKDVLPLLLDATPLPAKLGEYQWIDFRGTVGASHAMIAGPPPAALGRTARWLPLGGLAAVVAIAAALSLILGKAPQSPDVNVIPGPAVPGPAPVPPQGPGASFDLTFPGTGILLLAVVALVLTAWAARRWMRRSRPAQPAAAPNRPPGEIERRMASEVEAEILRRAAMRRDN